jgi:DNA ligase-1
LDGQSLLALPFTKRREKLVGLMAGHTDGLVVTEQRLVTQPQAFNDYFQKMVTEGLEGLMAKKPDAAYQAGARNFVWIKYKVGMQSELADTVDCVLLGYYRGRGKRNKFGIGAFLVGIPDGKGKFLSVSKIGTGLTDAQWREMYKRCQKSKVKSQKKPNEYEVHKNLYPDVWCEPRLVVEIEADTITRSPIHTAGLALRFPRLKRFRDDKEPNQATSLKYLKRLA